MSKINIKRQLTKFFRILLIFILIISFTASKFSLNLRENIGNGVFIPHIAWIAHKLSYENNLIKNMDHLSFRTIESEDEQFRCNILTIQRKESRKIDIIVVFRGTELDQYKNIIADINVLPKTTDGLCDGCFVHRGFYNAYEKIKEEVIKNLKEEIELRTKMGKEVENMFFTGHSLGGGIAIIAAYDFLNRRASKNMQDLYFKLINNVSLITFGTPRVGTSSFKDFFNRRDLLRDNLRVVYGIDVFPDLVAGYPLSFYRHFGDFAHFPENNFDEPQVFDRTEVDKWVRPDTIMDKFNAKKKIAHHRVYSLLNPKGVEEAIIKMRIRHKRDD